MVSSRPCFRPRSCHLGFPHRFPHGFPHVPARSLAVKRERQRAPPALLVGCCSTESSVLGAGRGSRGRFGSRGLASVGEPGEGAASRDGRDDHIPCAVIWEDACSASQSSILLPAQPSILSIPDRLFSSSRQPLPWQLRECITSKCLDPCGKRHLLLFIPPGCHQRWP